MENNNEQAKQQGQGQKQLPFNQLEQVDADRALAVALQEQESSFTMLERIGSDIEEDYDNEDEDEIESSSSHDFDSNLESEDLYELQFLEEDGEGSYTDDQMEEDEIDPDDMSYEELIALGEVVGEESRGLSVEEIASSLSPYVHKGVESKTIIDRCVICQIEYEEAEQLAALHQCKHPFHTECINQWLQIKKVCPICSIEVNPPNDPNKM